MKITIHRGINQIGGCITEITTDKTRILIDLGQNLPNAKGETVDDLAKESAIVKLTEKVDAILYTHYHGDHIGLFHLVPDKNALQKEIKQHIGSTAQKVALCKHNRLSLIKDREELSALEIDKLERMETFSAEQVIQIGDIRVIPYFVSHSACDAFMFEIEADGKRVLHTGDFRGHGYLSAGLIPTIEKLILPKGKIDVLITEGTMLSRSSEKVKAESEIKEDFGKLMSENKKVFVICSSTDMDRLSSIYRANKEHNKPFVCDDYQEKVLKIFTESYGGEYSYFNFDKVYSFWKGNKKLINWMKNKGFCMLIRNSEKFEDYLNFLETQIDLSDAILIYSMWKEYINQQSVHCKPSLVKFIERFSRVEQLHTSGHATPKTLAEVCNLVNPTTAIIPIHSEFSSKFSELDITQELKEKITLSSCTKNQIQITI